MLLSKTQVSIKAEVRSWNYTGFISYFYASFFLFKQSHSPGLQPNLSILEPLCKQWSWISTTQFCSAFASEKLSSLEKYLWVPEPMCTQTDCVDVYNESGSQTNAFTFFHWKVSFFTFSYLHSQHAFTQKPRHKLSNFNTKHVDATLDRALRVFPG